MQRASSSRDHHPQLEDNDERNLSQMEKGRLSVLEVSLDIALLKEAMEDTNKPEIGRVPMSLFNNSHFKKYFEPSFIGFGPLHTGFVPESGSSSSAFAKIKMRNLFLQKSGTSVGPLYSEIKKEIKSLINCYNRDYFIEAYSEAINEDNLYMVKWDDEKLFKAAAMFLEDGCAVLQFIYCIAKEPSELRILTNYQFECVKKDLLLLENQLPFQLLQLLINACSDQRAAELRQTIERFIDDNVMILGENKGGPQEISNKEENAQHLLALLQRRMIFQGQPVNKVKGLHQDPRRGLHNGGRFRHNIKELNKKGIWLSASKTDSLKDVSFNRCIFKYCGKGILMLPAITVNEFTVPKLMNLIAYEMMSPDFKPGFEVNSYLSLLDSLIDRAKDINELIDAEVVINSLGGNEDVANLFNEIAKNLTPDPEAYSEIKSKIEEHCEYVETHIIPRIYYQVLNSPKTYFKKPWSFILSLVAFFGFAFAATQTYYTIRFKSM